MLKTLLRKQMTEIFRTYFYDTRKSKPRSKASTIFLFVMFGVLMIGVLGTMFTLLSVFLCAPLTEAGLAWMYFTVMALLAILLGAFGSVFNTFAGLYLAKDNDLLLSMPLPVRYILAARLLGVYLLGLMYSGVLLLPAVIVYWCMASFSLQSVLGGILLILTVSGIVLFLSCALGWVVAQISRKLPQQKPYHGADLADFHRRVLLLLRQGAEPDAGSHSQRRLLRCQDTRRRLSALPAGQDGRRGSGCSACMDCRDGARAVPDAVHHRARLHPAGDLHRNRRPHRLPGEKGARRLPRRGTPAAGICPLSRQSDLYAQLRSRLGNRRCVRRVPADPQQLGLRKSVGAVRGGGDRHPPLCPHRRRCRMHGAVHGSNHRALGFAGGQNDLAVTEPAGHAVAGSFVPSWQYICGSAESRRCCAASPWRQHCGSPSLLP